MCGGGSCGVCRPLSGRPRHRVAAPAGVFLLCGLGGVLLFRVWLGAVPLALGVLASGFGMGPGVSSPLWPPRGLWWGACRGCRGCCCVVWWLVGCGGWVGCGPYSGRGVFPWCLVPSLLSVGSWPVGVGGVCGCVCVGLLVPVGCARCRVFTSGLSTQWCSGGLPGGVLLWRPGLEDGFPLRCFQRLSLSERGQPVVPLAGQLAH